MASCRLCSSAHSFRARVSSRHNPSQRPSSTSFFVPVSYSAEPDPDSPGFANHMGYEADLLTALEAMEGRSPAFLRRPIADWPGTWLLSATPEFDIVGGGITILGSRTLDATGRRVVAFTSGHIAFRQSLLTRRTRSVSDRTTC